MGSKTGADQPKENRKEMNGLVGAKNRGLGGPTLGKEKKTNGLGGLKQGAGWAT